MARTTKLDGERPPTGERPPRTSRATSSGAAGGGGGGATAAPKTSPLRGDDKKLRDALVNLYASAGMGAQGIATMRGDVGLVAAGANVALNAEAVADAWLDLARQNPRVRTMLEGFVQGSSVATLIGLHMAMIVPLLASRGMIDPAIGNMMLHPEARAAAESFAERVAAAKAHTNGGAAAA